MNARFLFSTLVVAALAGAGGWYLGQRHTGTPATSTASTGRRILYYQSAMHPWIKSDKPGKCTICGMDLSPVYEGDQGFSAGEGVVTLGSNIIQVIHVQSQEVRRAALRRTLRVAGTIESDATRRRVVSAYVDGRMDRLSVNFVGAEVKAGEPLASLYSPTLLAAEREYAVLRRTAGTRTDADTQALLQAAGQRLLRLGLTEAQVEAVAQKGEADTHTEVLAPLAGTVVERFAFEGQYVKEGDRLFDVADFSTMWFQFDAYERDLAWLAVGQSVEVTLPSAPGRSFQGTIGFIDPNVRDMTRSAKVRVELPNPVVESQGRPRRLLSNQAYAEGSVHIDAPEVVLVPRSAVLSPGGAPVAYVDQGGGAFELRNLQLGRLGDEAWEVLDGLRTGEKVVVNGNMLIDAQAQLNRGIADPAPAATNEVAAAKSVTLSAPQLQALTKALGYVDRLGEALASDKLESFNQLRAEAGASLQPLMEAIPDGTAATASARALVQAGKLSAAQDLTEARRSFHGLSSAAVALLRLTKPGQAELAAFHILRCPMTKKAFPGAPSQAEWIQTGKPVHNPWFGSEMLDCGNEVP